MTRVLLAERLHPDHVDGSRVAILNELNDRIAAGLSSAGATVERVSSLAAAERSDAVAVVLPGGHDLGPRRYGAPADPATTGVEPDQDDLDLGLAALALGRGLAILGICRGHQVINVACGGTLVQHLDHHRPADDVDLNDPDVMTRPFIEHDVTTTAGSWAARVIGERATIASGHHQAIRTVGHGLSVTAQSADGVIEAVEDRDRRLFGVQWHPECLGLDHGLFAAFLHAIRP